MTINGISHRRIAQNDPPPPLPPPPKYFDDATTNLLDRIERSYDAGIIAAAARAATGPNTDILYIGLNTTSADAEKNALAKTGSVRSVGIGPTLDGIRYDFSTGTPAANERAIRAFVDNLKVDPSVASRIEEALVGATPSHRTTLAQIALALSTGERGGTVPSRVVISAHSGGSDLYGDVGGFTIDEFRNILSAMPHVKMQIEDLHLSACSTSGQAGLDDERKAWLHALPHLKTIWAYAGSAGKTPVRDLETWGKMTNHAHDTLDVPLELRGHRIAIWSEKSGYRDSVSLTELREDQRTADNRFRGFVTGSRSAFTNAGHEDALRDYEAYRVLSQRSDVPAAERAVFAKRADQLLRIRYYFEVQAAFAKRNIDAVKNGFAAVGMSVPDFAAEGRSKALETIRQFEVRLSTMNPPPAAASVLAPLLRGLRDLEPTVVPESDCRHQ